MPGKVNPDRDEPVSMDLDTETALRALLEVVPHGDDADDEPSPE